LGYDAWIQNLLSVGSNTTRTLICVADLIHKKEGDNPHIWYDPDTMPILAKVLSNFLIKTDAKHRKEYQANYQRFIAQQQNLRQLIERIKAQHKGISVIATEPVFGYMARALDFRMKGTPFQYSIDE